MMRCVSTPSILLLCGGGDIRENKAEGILSCVTPTTLPSQEGNKKGRMEKPKINRERQHFPI